MMLFVNNVKWIQTIPYCCSVVQLTSPPVSKFYISSHRLYNAKNCVLPEAEMAKHLLIGVHFQRVRTVSLKTLAMRTSRSRLTRFFVAAILGGYIHSAFVGYYQTGPVGRQLLGRNFGSCNSPTERLRFWVPVRTQWVPPWHYRSRATQPMGYVPVGVRSEASRSRRRCEKQT